MLGAGAPSSACLSVLVLQARPVAPLQVGVIGRRTELVLIPSGQGRMRTVSPHELPVGGGVNRYCRPWSSNSSPRNVVPR